MIEDPIFIVGTTRAGTTLLGLMLGHHPDIAFAGEFEWALEQISADGEYPRLDEYHRWLATNRHFCWHGLQVDERLDFEALTKDFLAQMKRQAGDGKSKVCVSVHHDQEHLIKLWPRARLLYIVRDGRDVAASWIQMGWTGNIGMGLTLWAQLRHRWNRLSALLPREQVFETRFEDLVADAHERLAEICAFLGVPYSDQMLRYPDDSTYSAVDPGQAEKWRAKLSRREMQLAEAVAGTELAEAGYPMSGHPALSVGPVRQTMLRIDDRIRVFRARIRRFGFPLWLTEYVGRRLRIKPMHERALLRMNEIINSQVQ